MDDIETATLHVQSSHSRHSKHRKHSSKDSKDHKHSQHGHSNHHSKKHHHPSRSKSPKRPRSKSPTRSIDALKGNKRRLEGSRADSQTSLSLSLGSHDTFDTFDTFTTNRKYTKEEKKNQARDLDEALFLYGYAETAARRIQAVFRERQKEKEMNDKESEVPTEESADFKKADDDDHDDAASEDKSGTYTLVFLALCALVTTAPKLFMTCWGLIKKCLGGDDTGGVDAVANATMPQGGGGGAGGAVGPTPTGGEAGAAGGAQAGAQGAMAAQAASSAAGGAASGVASGAAAGAAASSAAAAATAGATAAAAGATQVAAVVAVSTAAVAATTVAVANPTPEPILSVCGLANPDIRSGRMVMLFEGVPRPFNERESGLVENLVVESYNEITMGADVAVTGCLDPLAREMQSISIVNQTLSSLTSELSSSMLEVVFEAKVSCDRCSESSPLFSEDQLDEQDNTGGGNSTDTTVNTTDSLGDNAPDFGIVSNATAEGVVQLEDVQSRQLQKIDFSSQKFFQKLIQLVIFETEELSDEGELPEGFVQISKALVVTNDEEEEVLVTEIKYKREADRGSDTGSGGSGGSGGGGGRRENVMATFEFGYVDESGEVQKETIEVTEEGGAVPTTAFPTFQPSHAPTDMPSSEPTNAFSGQPTTLPSAQPTDTPSGIPSMPPSEAPSTVPSMPPSQVPSTVPSGSPSMLPSESPSEAPSSVPSTVPSEIPSTTPSMAPSMIPSAVPSMAPSMIPSTLPSMIPSFIPSETPSFVPSFVPSDVPSMKPSMIPSASPSKSPTSTPSSQPTVTVQLIQSNFVASQSSYHSGVPASVAINGNTAGNYALGQTIHTLPQNNNFWQVDIGAGWGNRPSAVKTVSIWNRADCCLERLYGCYIQLLDASGGLLQQQMITSSIGAGGQTFTFTPTPNVYFIRVQQYGLNSLQIAEVKATGYVL